MTLIIIITIGSNHILFYRYITFIIINTIFYIGCPQATDNNRFNIGVVMILYTNKKYLFVCFTSINVYIK